MWCVNRQPVLDRSGEACSPDDEVPSALAQAAALPALRVDRGHGAERGHAHHGVHPRAHRRAGGARGAPRRARLGAVRSERREPAGLARGRGAITRGAPRSEEHTSELQSLMRISYAVFCLKKKKKLTKTTKEEASRREHYT